MKIVGVVFIKDHQSVHSGNEFYKSGTAAHFPDRHASALIRKGVARSIEPVAEPEPEPEPPAPKPKAKRKPATRKRASTSRSKK